MGGPGASVLLREPLSMHQHEGLKVRLQLITRMREDGSTPLDFQFWLKRDVFLEPVSECIFYFGIYAPERLREDENERQQVVEQLGYLPQQEIEIGSGCNDDSDHRTLGLLILHVAETYGGLIDMEGAIQPPLPPVDKEFWEEFGAKLSAYPAYFGIRFKEIEATLPPGTTMSDLSRQIHSDPDSPINAVIEVAREKFGPLPERPEPSLQEVSEYVHSIPGTVYEIYYQTPRHTRWVSHIVDATFLRAWMNYPNFT